MFVITLQIKVNVLISLAARVIMCLFVIGNSLLSSKSSKDILLSEENNVEKEKICTTNKHLGGHWCEVSHLLFSVILLHRLKRFYIL